MQFQVLRGLAIARPPRTLRLFWLNSELSKASTGATRTGGHPSSTWYHSGSTELPQEVPRVREKWEKWPISNDFLWAFLSLLGLWLGLIGFNTSYIGSILSLSGARSPSGSPELPQEVTREVAASLHSEIATSETELWAKTGLWFVS